MKLDNKYIHDACVLVEEEDLKEATKIGLEMLTFVRKKKYLSLAANQVGHNKQIIVAMDDDGHDIYFNPEIQPELMEDGLISIAPEANQLPIVLPSFPKKKVMVEIYDKIEVNAFSLANDDRITFKAEGTLAKIWQITTLVMNGVDKDSIIPGDFMTIRGSEKKKPNAKCQGCGKKNKKCRCPEPAIETEPETKLVSHTPFELGKFTSSS